MNKNIKYGIQFLNSKTDDVYSIEIKNSYGEKGWLHSDVDYIIFELLNGWLIVNRKKIIDLIKEKAWDYNIYSTISDVYKFYQTEQKDLRIRVLTKDLMKISSLSIKKNE